MTTMAATRRMGRQSWRIFSMQARRCSVAHDHTSSSDPKLTNFGESLAQVLTVVCFDFGSRCFATVKKRKRKFPITCSSLPVWSMRTWKLWVWVLLDQWCSSTTVKIVSGRVEYLLENFLFLKLEQQESAMLGAWIELSFGRDCDLSFSRIIIIRVGACCQAHRESRAFSLAQNLTMVIDDGSFTLLASSIWDHKFSQFQLPECQPNWVNELCVWMQERNCQLFMHKESVV